MDPVLFQYQSFTIYTYGFSLAVAALITAFLIWRRLRRFGYQEIAIIDMVLVSALLALFFARAFYVGSHWSDFGTSLLQILLVTYFPGLDGVGAMLGVITGVLIFTFFKQWRALDVLDSVFFALGLGIAIVMLGTFFAGSLPGTVSYLPWASVYPGLIDRRHPIPLYWMMLSFIFFGFAVILDKYRRISGLMTSLFLYIFGVALFIFTPITEMQTNSVLVVYFFAIVMLVVAAVLTFLIWKRLPYWKDKNDQEDTSVTAPSL